MVQCSSFIPLCHYSSAQSLSTLMCFSHTDTSLKILSVEILLLHLQPFSNSHFHFFITAKSLASQLLLHWFKTSFLHSWCVLHIQHWISWADHCDQHHGCPTILNSAPFFNMLHSYYAITSMNDECGVIFNGRICFTPKKQVTLSWLSYHCHCHCTSTYPMHGISLTLAPSVACYSYYMC